MKANALQTININIRESNKFKVIKMNKVITLLMLLLFLASCEEQNRGLKTKEEIEKYSIACVKHFLNELHDGDDDARKRCVVYSLSENDSTTLYDIAKSMNVDWDPGEVKIDTTVKFIVDSTSWEHEGKLSYVVVNTHYKGRQASFAVTFDHDFHSEDGISTLNLFLGSEGKAIIVDSQGFLPAKNKEYEKKAKAHIAFSERWDLMSYVLSEKSIGYIKKADSFLYSIKCGEPNYVNYRSGKIFGKFVLPADSASQAILNEVEFKYNLKDIVNKKIDLSFRPCEVKYTTGISFLFENGEIVDSRGVFDGAQYCVAKYSQYELTYQEIFPLFCDTDQAWLKLIQDVVERKKQDEELRRSLEELERIKEEQGIDYIDYQGNPHYKSE